MLVENWFGGEGFQFRDHAPGIREPDILDALGQKIFPGIDDFIKFFTTAHGGYFVGGAYFYRDVFLAIDTGDYDTTEVESFYYIGYGKFHDAELHLRAAERVREIKGKWSEERRIFCQNHFPFAGDAGDNDYWIDLDSGEIKWVPWESEENLNNIIDIAPSFADFVNHIVPRRRSENHP